MKRLGTACVLGLALVVVAGCGAAQMGPVPPAVPVGNLGAPLALAPLLMGRGGPPTTLAGGGRAGRAAPFLIAPSTDLAALAGEGFTAVGALCRTSPDSLLWHGGGLFSWQDLGSAPLYVARGADLATLAIAVARYRDVLPRLPAIVPAEGGTAAFLKAGQGFLLAPEPLSSALVASGRAHLAQALADELGPYPTCLVYARRTVLREDPLLVVALLRRLDMGLWQLETQGGRRELPELRALAPATAPIAILGALAAARAADLFRDTVLLGDEDLRLLHQEIVPGVWSQGTLDLGPATAALRRPFVP